MVTFSPANLSPQATRWSVSTASGAGFSGFVPLASPSFTLAVPANTPTRLYASQAVEAPPPATGFDVLGVVAVELPAFGADASYTVDFSAAAPANTSASGSFEVPPHPLLQAQGRGRVTAYDGFAPLGGNSANPVDAVSQRVDYDTSWLPGVSSMLTGYIVSAVDPNTNHAVTSVRYLSGVPPDGAQTVGMLTPVDVATHGGLLAPITWSVPAGPAPTYVRVHYEEPDQPGVIMLAAPTDTAATLPAPPTASPALFGDGPKRAYITTRGADACAPYAACAQTKGREVSLP